MLLVVGLGNPGEGYANNRHNIGFMAVDSVARRYSFAPFRSKFHGEISQGTIIGNKVLALKPSTFMNESGRSVRAVMDFYKIPLNNMCVIHDEIDLAGGKVRVKLGGGHAGHNGLRSIQAQVGREFVRVRIGVGHPGDKDKVAGYVLKNFAQSEQKWVDKVIDAVGEYIPILADGDYAMFMSKVSNIVGPLQWNTPSSGEARSDGNQIGKKVD